MTKIETVIARLRALPDDEAEALAHEFEALIEEGDDYEVDPEDLARIERELDEPTVLIPHDEVMARLETKYLK